MHNFSASLPSEVQAAIEEISTFRRIAKQQAIVLEGDHHHELYQICEGEAKSYFCDSLGRETVAAFINKGDWVGLSEVFSGLPALSEVMAMTDVRLRVIKKQDMDTLIDVYPIIARHLLRILSLRFSAMYYLNADRQNLSLKERVVKTLYMLSFSHGKKSEHNNHIVIQLSQEELGKVLAVSRQNLNKVLKELEREGLLAISYGAIKLLGLPEFKKHYGYLVNANQPTPV